MNDNSLSLQPTQIFPLKECDQLTLYLPHFESQYLVHLQILIKIVQETLSFPKKKQCETE